MTAFTISVPGKPDEHRTFDESIVKVGRDPRSHIQVADESVARMHAVIEIAEDAVTVIDLGSSIGTFVNDERTNKKTLALGDRIRVGPATITLGHAPESPLRLPSPEVVRDRVGPSFAPTNVFGVAAIVLRVDGVRRHAWSDETELAERLFESYPRGAIPAPELVPESRNFKTIDDAGATNARRCSKCVIRPGFEPCPLCLGTGAGSKLRRQRQVLRVHRRSVHPVQRLRWDHARRRVRRSLRERSLRANAPRVRPVRSCVDPLAPRSRHLAG